MNIDDTKLIQCSKCGKFIGEIDYDASVIFQKCGKCAKQLSEESDTIHVTSKYKEIQDTSHKPTLC